MVHAISHLFWTESNAASSSLLYVKSTYRLKRSKKNERLRFHSTYRPNFSSQVTNQNSRCMTFAVSMAPNNTLFPEPSEKLINKLFFINKLGFKVLPMTNFLTARLPVIPKEMYINFKDETDFWLYAEKLSKCSAFIASLGCGCHSIFELKSKFKINETPLHTLYETLPEHAQLQFEGMIAEWADGDGLSAHYAYGNDYFCTNDSASNAGSNSIFSEHNRNAVENRFGIHIVSSTELLNLF